MNVAIQVTGSQILGAPGTYIAMATGITLSLPSWATWAAPGSIVIKDGTGTNPPNVVVEAAAGLIDNAASVTLLRPYESITFVPSTNGVNWAMT